jgi:hypothetical protein
MGSEFLQYLTEKRHFLLSASRHLEDQMWVDYKGLLYFRPNTKEALDIVNAIRESRNRYVAFTNVDERDELRLKVLQESGISPRYLRHLTTPCDPTNAVPVLHEKRLRLLPAYTVIKSFENGDALIKTKTPDSETLYVYQHGRTVDNREYGKILLIPEGLTTYQNAIGANETGIAYRRVDLTDQDKETLRRIRDTCAKFAAQLASAIDELKKPPVKPKPPENLRVLK